MDTVRELVFADKLDDAYALLDRWIADPTCIGTDRHVALCQRALINRTRKRTDDEARDWESAYVAWPDGGTTAPTALARIASERGDLASEVRWLRVALEIAAQEPAIGRQDIALDFLTCVNEADITSEDRHMCVALIRGAHGGDYPVTLDTPSLRKELQGILDERRAALDAKYGAWPR